LHGLFLQFSSNIVIDLVRNLYFDINIHNKLVNEIVK
jgi:hypothetical protein